MKKNALILMIGLLVCMLAGCGEAKEPETADEALEQIESEIEEMIAEEEEEKTPEESLVDVYVPGTIPPGTYVRDESILHIYEDKTFELSNMSLYMYGTYTYVYDEENDTYTFDMSYDVEEPFAMIFWGKYVDGNIVMFAVEMMDQPEKNSDNIEFVYVRQ